ncbi:MAG: MFS transporter [Dehalococcoidales bacterium]|nr:MFS transporter [Dehalococcoidales bacterium]
MKKPKIFYGWVVIGAAFTISLFLYGLVGSGFSALIEPLRNQFGWSYTQISIAGSLRGLETGILAPLMGILVDRWGPRRLVLIGTIMVGLGFILLSRVTSLGLFYTVYALIALGFSGLSPTVTMTAASNWFHKRAGTAVGIMHSGVGFSGLMVPLIVFLVDSRGWQQALIILGACAVILIAPLAIFLRHKPEQYGLLPDGETGHSMPADRASAEPRMTTRDFKPGEALRSHAFWHISLAMGCQLLMVNAVTTHIMPYLGSVGVARATAGVIASAVPLASVLGRLGFGWLGDRLNRKQIMILGYAMMALSFPFFALTSSSSMGFIFPFLALFSVGFGGNAVLRAAIVNEYYGRTNFGTIHGFIMGVAVLGNIAGPPLAGWVYDTWGAYQGIWWSFIAVSLVALVLMVTSSKPKRPRGELVESGARDTGSA